MAEAESLFDSTFLRQLEALDAALLPLRGAAGEGARGAGAAQGRSEFRGHRPYSPGDDLRRLDWNAYGRLGKFFMREYEHERAEHVTILLDCSRSMAAGEPPKHVLARRACAAFAYLVLKRGGTATLSGNTPVSGLSRFNTILDQLRNAPPDNDATLADGAGAVAERSRAPGDLIVVSDGLEPLESFKPLQSLSERRTRVTLVQVLSPDEIDPPVGGVLELHGQEENASMKLTIDASMAMAYQAELEKHLESLAGIARRHAWLLALCESDANLHELFVGKLLKAGASL